MKSRSKPNNHIAKDLLSRAHSPDSTDTIYTEKVRHRPLHLIPTTSITPTSNAQQQRRQLRSQKLLSRKKKLKPHPLSSRQKRSLLLYDIPRSEQKYSIYEPMNRMWQGYILEILSNEGNKGEVNLPVTGNSVAKVCGADFHGAEVEVVRSGCPSRVGVRGIVFKDSRGVFEIVTKGDKLKVLPKERTVFRVRIPLPKQEGEGEWEGSAEDKHMADREAEVEKNEMSKSEVEKSEMAKSKGLVFEIHGDQFIHRAADRATKKFRWHFLPNV